MKLHTLLPSDGSIKKAKRIGRGGKRGRTCGKGTKGAQSRSGYSSKIGFEGGQTPLYKRIPRFGFKNFNRVVYKSINLYTIASVCEDHNIKIVNPEILSKYSIIRKNELYKILSTGELPQDIEIHAHAFSTKAYEKILKAKGKCILIDKLACIATNV